jgi:hypothetical protein
MSEIRVNTITDEAGTGSPSFPNGIAATQLTGSIDAARLTSVPAANLTGNVAAAQITTALNATGSAPLYACRAWVNFNGTGTVAIRGSGNVSSITDNNTGNYTVNFTTAMSDENYAINAFAKRGDNVANIATVTARNAGVYSNSAVEVLTYQGSWTLTDFPTICVAVFR